MTIETIHDIIIVMKNKVEETTRKEINDEGEAILCAGGDFFVT